MVAARFMPSVSELVNRLKRYWENKGGQDDKTKKGEGKVLNE